VLGTKDFYDTDYGTGGEYPGTGEWDIMGIGSWNGDGACPAHFNPYSKIYDFGWATAKIVGITSSQRLNAKQKDAFIRINTATSGEYFLLEYRVQSGFDSKIPGHGLMIYRATDNLSNKEYNTINTTHRQQFYPLVANASYALPTSSASSYGTVNSASAPFPGSYNVTKITDDTTPSLKSWNGTATNLPISSISEDRWGEYVTFDVAAKIVNQSITPASGATEDISTIQLTFDRPTYIDTSVGSITITSTDPNDYGRDINASISYDGLTATITCSPSKSVWTLSQTYRMEIPAGFFTNRQGLKSDAIRANWTIMPKRFTYTSVSPTQGVVDSIEEIILTFPVDFVSTGGSYPAIDIFNDQGNIVATVATVKTTDNNGNPALKATLDTPITTKGTYQVALFDNLLIDTSGTMLNSEIFLSWTIESSPFMPIVTPVSGEISKEELLVTTITVPSPIASFDGTGVCFSKQNSESVRYDNAAVGTIAADRMSLTIAWDFSPEAGCDYKLLLPAGCITLDNGDKNEVVSMTYTVVSGPKDSAEFVVPAGIDGYLYFDVEDSDAWAPEFLFTASTTANNTIKFAAQLPSLPADLTAIEVIDSNDQAIALLDYAHDGAIYRVEGETTKEYADGAELKFRFRFTHLGVSETIQFSYIVAGGNITSIADVELDGNVIVRGNDIIAPEGAAIFTVSGIRVPAEDLAPGVYVVVLGNQAVKVMVK
jgi:hypothetical protein